MRSSASDRTGLDLLRAGRGRRGPWVKKIWDYLDLPEAITFKGRDGKLHSDVPMWTYWCLEEGTLGVDPNMHKLNDGGFRLSSTSIPMRRSIPTSTAR